MDIGNVASLISVSLAVLLAFFGGFRFIVAQGEALRREIGSVSKEAALLVDKLAESEAKQRHSANNYIQTLLAKLELEFRQLQREAVRLEQMQAVEQRLNGALGKIEVKVDRLSDSLAVIEAMKAQMQTILSTMSRISDRLDEDSGVRRNTRVT
jgi:phosphoketolase